MNEITELEMQAPESEEALLGTVAFHGDAIAGILADLPGADFYGYVRGQVWDTCRALSRDRDPITPVTVAQRMVRDGTWSEAAQRITSGAMLGNTPAVYAARHAQIVAGFARRRELLRKANRVREILTRDADPSDLLALAKAEFDESPTDRGPSGPLGWDELVDEFEHAHAPGGSRPGIPSPWWELDDVIGGLFGGRVYVFGGRPGSGKSTATLVIAMHAAVESGKQSLVISKEMPTVDVTGRLLARGAEVSLAAINARRIDEYGMARIRSYIKQVGHPSITVDAKPRSLAGIKTLARAHHHRNGLDVLVVDYLQLVRTDTPSRSREQEVAEVSRQLKELALELDCVVCLPAQLNRGSTQRSDPRPNMSDLRDSGQIEQDADAVILLHRPVNEKGEPTGQILFIVDKNRHGPTAEVSLRWHGGYGDIA